MTNTCAGTISVAERVPGASNTVDHRFYLGIESYFVDLRMTFEPYQDSGTLPSRIGNGPNLFHVI